MKVKENRPESKSQDSLKHQREQWSTCAKLIMEVLVIRKWKVKNSRMRAIEP